MAIELTPLEQEARSRIVLPLDDIPYLIDEDIPFSERGKAASIESRVRELGPVVGWFKYGMGSHTRFGNEGLEVIQEEGGAFDAKVFLDLKFKDIPNTVRDASISAAERGVDMFNVHASGGYSMMKAAIEGVDKAAVRGYAAPAVIAVTVLTSIDKARFVFDNLPVLTGFRELGSDQYDQLKRRLANFDFTTLIDMDDERSEFKAKNKGEAYPREDEYNAVVGLFETIIGGVGGVEHMLRNTIAHYAAMADAAELDGIVCAAADLETVNKVLLPKSYKVTPGIKAPITGVVGPDQKRVLTPRKAIEDGATHLVVGRAITDYATLEEQVQGGLAVIRDAAAGLKQLPQYQHMD